MITSASSGKSNLGGVFPRRMVQEHGWSTLVIGPATNGGAVECVIIGRDLGPTKTSPPP